MSRLHLDTRLSGLPQREVEIRQMTLWACVIYDKYVQYLHSLRNLAELIIQILGSLSRPSNKYEVFRSRDISLVQAI